MDHARRSKLLITGSGGQIAHVLMPSLERDYDLLGLDKRPSTGDVDQLQLDISDQAAIWAVFRERGPFDRVLHLAAVADAEATWESVVANNIQGTWNVFRHASESGVGRVVFASSNHVTGMYEGAPPNLHLRQDPGLVNPSEPMRPDGPYGISKAAGELIARYFYDRDGLESVCLRIGTVLPDNDPTGNPRHLSTWLSHRDLCQLVVLSLEAERSFPGFGIYYGVSGNSTRFWDISNAADELGYRPQDDAAQLDPPQAS